MTSIVSYITGGRGDTDGEGDTIFGTEELTCCWGRIFVFNSFTVSERSRVRYPDLEESREDD